MPYIPVVHGALRGPCPTHQTLLFHCSYTSSCHKCALSMYLHSGELIFLQEVSYEYNVRGLKSLCNFKCIDLNFSRAFLNIGIHITKTLHFPVFSKLPEDGWKEDMPWYTLNLDEFFFFFWFLKSSCYDKFKGLSKSLLDHVLFIRCSQVSLALGHPLNWWSIHALQVMVKSRAISKHNLVSWEPHFVSKQSSIEAKP